MVEFGQELVRVNTSIDDILGTKDSLILKEAAEIDLLRTKNEAILR